jgi:hypothetical protein
VETQEKEDALSGGSGKVMKLGKKFGGPKKKEMMNAAETKPSPVGRRIVPKVDLKLKEKFEKETLSKENKGKRVSNVCISDILSLSVFHYLPQSFVLDYLYCEIEVRYKKLGVTFSSVHIYLRIHVLWNVTLCSWMSGI